MAATRGVGMAELLFPPFHGRPLRSRRRPPKRILFHAIVPQFPAMFKSGRRSAPPRSGQVFWRRAWGNGLLTPVCKCAIIQSSAAAVRVSIWGASDRQTRWVRCRRLSEGFQALRRGTKRHSGSPEKWRFYRVPVPRNQVDLVQRIWH